MRRLDVTGLDDQDHLAVIGVVSPSSMQRAPVLQQIAAGSPHWTQSATPQGVSTPSEELDYLPLEGVDFTNSGIAAVPLEDKLVALPQRPFRGERLILTCIYITVGGVVTDNLYAMFITPAIYVGAVQVGATQGLMPAGAFGATAFGVRLSMPTAGQGTRIYIPFLIPVVGPSDRVIVGGGIFGRAVR